MIEWMTLLCLTGENERLISNEEENVNSWQPSINVPPHSLWREFLANKKILSLIDFSRDILISNTREWLTWKRKEEKVVEDVMEVRGSVNIFETISPHVLSHELSSSTQRCRLWRVKKSEKWNFTQNYFEEMQIMTFWLIYHCFTSLCAVLWFCFFQKGTLNKSIIKPTLYLSLQWNRSQNFFSLQRTLFQTNWTVEDDLYS